MKRSVSVVVASSRASAALGTGLPSLAAACTRAGVELVVVCAGSPPEVRALARGIPDARLVVAPVGSPPAQLREWGLAEAAGDIVLLSEKCTAVNEDWLSALAQHSEREADDVRDRPSDPAAVDSYRSWPTRRNRSQEARGHNRGLALLARIAAAVALGSSFHFAHGSAYVDTARRLLSGDEFGVGYQRVPAYPVLLAVLAAPLPAGLVLWRAAQAVPTATGCVLLYLLVSQMFGAVPARVAALPYPLDPVLVVASGLLYPEAITAALMIPTILFV